MNTPAPPPGLVALVTGGNRGIGLEVSRQLADRGVRVLVGCRDESAGTEAVANLSGVGHGVIEVDVSTDAGVAALADRARALAGRVDILVNNAGGFYDADQSALGADFTAVRAAFELNLFGAWRTTRELADLLAASPFARVVMVSSGAGSHADANFGLPTTPALPAYGLSKAALNALTVKLAVELAPRNVLVNAVCPGWTATQPGSAEHGARPVADGAASVVWACLLPANGPTGGFFRDGQPLGW